MEINLLPKESPAKRYRLLGILAAAVLLVAGTGTTIYSYVSLASTSNELHAELNRVKQDNTVLAAERTVNADTRKFKTLMGAVDKLIFDQNNYTAMLDNLASKLSEKTKVEFLDVDTSKQKMVLKLRTNEAGLVEEYAELLHNEVWVENIVITNIVQLDAAKESGGGYSAQLEITVKARKAQEF
ncbi:hypothetical protein [Tumebacillus permanentifrigoris]|uniref:Uncharacterized protein n=1 Tax=Tumebacillus permanentifrigoris TaxID=378543 RepID=A0A316D5Z3_9BACL|nr:hypothetical protein [Tumebacillus permanentifrigoris]PWK06256.1 hypothetical protein C7459_12019 [Tumebacillus permanentifrigoris]